ncbi:hypothetical protein [Actinokineospora terrae]|uniref:Uncharacterized protein n=1 Tax=Actinokineospora terrae TaxID=155974 RepID=A0A1H9VU89_9PSEU|nr:hypothetical protein [Actinokineospora terrae]SES25091.1 hypothetical protein SAMN04487818_10978 [Actinokineospora terrae]
MDEHSLRTALHEAMSGTPTPPAMDSEQVLHDARQAKRAHRAKFAGFASAAAVVVVAVGAFALSGLGGGDTITVGNRSTPTVTTTGPTASGTRPKLPEGQTDRTQTSGPHADLGKDLLDRVLAVVPGGYSAPARVAGSDIPARAHQAQVVDDNAEVWEYTAYTAIGKDDRWGRLVVEVIPSFQGAVGCDVPREGMDASCETTKVGDNYIPVHTATRGTFQWATYLHPDGVRVLVTQAQEFTPAVKPLAAYPLTPQQLAALAMDPRLTLR